MNKNYVKEIIQNAQFNRVNTNQHNTPYDIIVPVYNGYDALKDCLNSIIKHTDPKHQVWLYNDASTDPQVKAMIDETTFAHRHIHGVHHSYNMGYLKNVNQAILNTNRDVILLNADTQVTAKWLDEMALVANEPEIAVVCPLSDNATLLTLNQESVKQKQHINNYSGCYYPIPTAVGSCMLIKRNIIEKFGVFDEYYHPGYGEECDYSFKVRQAGHHIACAPAAFVHHKGSVSFANDADKLKRQHQNLLDLRWPHYQQEIQHFLSNNPAHFIEQNLHNRSKNKKTILHVVHGLNNKGGVELFTNELLAYLPKDINNIVLIPIYKKIPTHGVIIEQKSENLQIIYYQVLNRNSPNKVAFHNADLQHPELDVMFCRYLLNIECECVHFHSLVSIGSLMWPLICKELGVPFVFSSHDHFPICFNYLLLTDQRTRYCRKTLCSENDNSCVNCLDESINFNALNTPEYIEQRNHIWQEIFKHAVKIICPDPYLSQLIHNKVPSPIQKKLCVIEPYFYPKKSTIQSRKTDHKNAIRVAYVGAFSFEKGAHLFIAAHNQLSAENIEWQIIGTIHPFYQNTLDESNISMSGQYDREQLPQLLSTIDVVVIPSIHPETYSIVATEAWNNNLPVVASDIGALKSRVKNNKNGMLFSAGDSDSLAAVLKKLANEPELVDHMKQSLTREKNTKENSGEKILSIYQAIFKQNSFRSHHVLQRNVQLEKPRKNAYEEMNQWLNAEMTLEAQSDWKDDQAINIVIIGASKKLIDITHGSCQVYAPNARVIISDDHSKLMLKELSSVFFIINAGNVINDNFGNWLFNFIKSHKGIGMADYALKNKEGACYAPQFLNRFDVLTHNRKSQRVGAIMICQQDQQQWLNKSINQVINNDVPLFSVIEQSINNQCVNLIHYFPHFSFLYDDVQWVKQWKYELNTRRPITHNTQQSSPLSLSIVLISTKNKKALKELITSLKKQRAINLQHIYVFTPEHQVFNDKISAHYIDFSQPEYYINPVIDRDNSKHLLFINDNLKIINNHVINSLQSQMTHHNLQAISPVLNKDDQYFITEKMGNGYVSSHGVLADIRFDAADTPIPAQLLDEDCFMISKDAWQCINGLSHTGHIFYRANYISSELNKHDLLLAINRISGISKKGAPSHYSYHTNGKLSEERQALIKHNSNFYTHSQFQSTSLTSDKHLKIDQYFGTFKTPRNLPRVIAYAHDSWASGFYRVKAPLTTLVANDKISCHFLPEQRQQKVASYFEIAKQQPHVIYLHNYLGDQQLNALENYRLYVDAPIIFSMDDLLTEVPQYNPFSQINPKDIDKRLTKALKNVDRLIVSTDYLANKYTHLHQDIVVIENSLPQSLWSQLPKRIHHTINPIRIGWAGASQHKKDLDWLKPVIEATHDKVQWVFYGDRPNNIDQNMVEFHSPTALGEYHIKLASLQLDIAIAPLVDNTFNRAKSQLKLIEYGAIGLATICSNIECYKKSPAIQLENDPQQWITTLLSLSKDHNARNQLAQSMKNWVEENYYLENNTSRWSKALFL